MNKKGKNKKGKVPNPTPSQEEKSGDKTEDLGVIGDSNPAKVSEVIENVATKTESVKEERVPEIVSEIITHPVDTKDEETPKKPKRNRGKKKKGKDDDFDDNLEETPKEVSVQPPAEETKDDTQTLKVEKEPLDTPIVTPTARKKKNKKKNVEQKGDEITTLDTDMSMPIALEDVIKEPEVSAIKEESTVRPETVEQEVKPTKKKNKKKKRSDSERSDKEEISCTAAFQKLIEVKDENIDIKMEENIEASIIPAESIKLEPELPPPKETIVQKPIIEKDTATSADLTSIEEKETEQTSVPESKSKKKNKKDKKHIGKSEESVLQIDKPIELPSLPLEKEILLENIIEIMSKDTISIDKPESFLQETSPKPKAKIAKPVEKKRKEKQDNHPIEDIPQDIIALPPKTKEQMPQVVLQSSEIRVTEKEIADTETKNIPQNLTVETTPDSTTASTSEQLKEITLKDFEPLNITDKTIGKKRKKGAKIPKVPDVSFEILESKLEIDSKQLDVETVDLTKEVPVVSESTTTKEQQVSIMSEKSEVPIIADSPIDVNPLDLPLPQTVIKDHVLVTPEVSNETKSLTSDTLVVEKAEDNQKFETKSAKKRKKSPKPPKKADTKPEIDVHTSKPVEECLPKSDVTREMGERIDASNITKMYDIEISSIKADESEGSICDTIPDITYPRASSQQLFDKNNNNTVIREILPIQAIIPDTPKVETIPAEKEHKVSPSKEEKTDIKSKMMEVNQDMEELRLSIERSLAELTAIEKSEEVEERKFEECKIKAERNIATIDIDGTMKKKDEHDKMIQISDAEKSEIPLQLIKNADVVQDRKKQLEKHQSTKDNILQEDAQIMKPEPDKTAEPIVISKSADITRTETKTETFTPVLIEDKPTPSSEISETAIKIAKKDVPLKMEGKKEEIPVTSAPLALPEEKKPGYIEVEKKDTEAKPKEEGSQLDTPPVCPSRKDNKNKHKKKKGKQDSQVTPQTTQSAQSTTSVTSQSTSAQDTKKEDKTDNKTDKKSDAKDTKEKGKQQASNVDPVTDKDIFSDMDYEPIEDFEDALTSSVDDVNKTFEMIVEESQEQSNPKINIIAPDEEKSPVSPPKNLLGQPDIPVPSNRRDYKKEKDKIPNEIAATIQIKDAMDIERKQSKNTQTINKLKDLKNCRISDNEEFVYKYSFRKVFLQSSCHVCKKDLAGSRVACCYCNLVFYCGIKHKDEDWPQHQALCFAVSTIGHLKDQKHIYADAKNITGHDYRLVRMQMIVSCEKVLKRRLVPWEQEALLYPRICAHVPCREWRQMKLSDCQGCGQISYCTDNQDHCPKTHARWCKSYNLYEKLVSYQQSKGRLEPRLPTKVMKQQYTIPEKINEVLAEMYEEKIDMNDIQYAALTQLATAPLTAAYCHQLYKNKNTTANGYKKSVFTIHVVGAELQFEADALNKWEVFFLHLRPDLQELRVVLINYNLNPSDLPLELLGKIKLCEDCRQNKRRVVFNFQDKRSYADYKYSEDFVVPDIVCAFNPSIQRSSVYNGKDPWPSTMNIILKQKIPFIITAYTITELHKDCIRIKECFEKGYNFVSEPKYNNFASVRPDRNFISDDEMPLLFKNYCFAIICG